MDLKTIVLMTMHKAVHPKYDLERLYVSRKDEGRKLTSTEDNVDASIQQLKYYIKRKKLSTMIKTAQTT